ncbi:MAG: transcription elongation factor GreA [Legionellaceae bacterium]|nr:transcription elongation factor GreA [Legionellaceae bacterium]
MQQHPMTPEGEAVLKEELNTLKTKTRPEIIEAIAVARAHGDLKENAEYHAAREQQSFAEGRIQELESKLSNARVIDVTTIPNDGKVVFGATVQLHHIQNETNTTYRIVGSDEANIKENKISYTSPIGRALIGKQLDDVVVVDTPGGLVEYEIMAVDYI